MFGLFGPFGIYFCNYIHLKTLVTYSQCQCIIITNNRLYLDLVGQLYICYFDLQVQWCFDSYTYSLGDVGVRIRTNDFVVGRITPLLLGYPLILESCNHDKRPLSYLVRPDKILNRILVKQLSQLGYSTTCAHLIFYLIFFPYLPLANNYRILWIDINTHLWKKSVTFCISGIAEKFFILSLRESNVDIKIFFCCSHIQLQHLIHCSGVIIVKLSTMLHALKSEVLYCCYVGDHIDIGLPYNICVNVLVLVNRL